MELHAGPSQLFLFFLVFILIYSHYYVYFHDCDGDEVVMAHTNYINRDDNLSTRIRMFVFSAVDRHFYHDLERIFLEGNTKTDMDNN